MNKQKRDHQFPSFAYKTERRFELGKAAEKIERMRKTLKHVEADRVPVGEFFWTGFRKRVDEKWGVGVDLYKKFDLDYVVITPNLDPHIKPFEILFQEGEDIIVKTGFEATIKRSGTIVMPHFEKFGVEKPDVMGSFTFDDPADPRRFYNRGDDQINGVSDALVRDIEAWDKRVDTYVEDFAVFGSVCGVYEYLWRIIGTENSLMWMILEPEKYGRFVERLGDHIYKMLEAQIEAGKGRLSGMYIWGDVAYVNGMLFGPPQWREFFKKQDKRLFDLCHQHNLMVIYHGCGDARNIYDDLVEINLDMYNPLECKAHLDVVELSKEYGNRLGFCGKIDVRILEKGNPSEIKKEVLYKLLAAQGGGYVFQSDHSISTDVDPDSYAFAIQTLREYGNYPLDVDRIKEELQRL